MASPTPFEKITTHLESDNPDDAASACLAICMLLNQGKVPPNTLNLPALVPKLVKLLDSDNADLQVCNQHV